MAVYRVGGRRLVATRPGTGAESPAVPIADAGLHLLGRVTEYPQCISDTLEKTGLGWLSGAHAALGQPATHRGVAKAVHLLVSLLEEGNNLRWLPQAPLASLDEADGGDQGRVVQAVPALLPFFPELPQLATERAAQKHEHVRGKLKRILQRARHVVHSKPFYGECHERCTSSSPSLNFLF